MVLGCSNIHAPIISFWLRLGSDALHCITLIGSHLRLPYQNWITAAFTLLLHPQGTDSYIAFLIHTLQDSLVIENTHDDDVIHPW